MKVPFRQNKTYGCGSYALANMFNEPKFLDFIEDGKGQQHNDLNYYLSKLRPDFLLSVLVCYLPQLEGRLTDKRIFDIQWTVEETEPIRQNNKRVFLISIQGKSLAHIIVAVQSFTEDIFWIADSLRDEIYTIPITDFLTSNHVVEIMCFEYSFTHSGGRMPEGDTMYFSNGYVSHIIKP